MRARNPSPIGAAVLAYRHKVGQTQIQFGALVQLTGNTIARIETGDIQEIRTGALCRIADVCGYSTDYLLGREGGGHARE